MNSRVKLGKGCFGSPQISQISSQITQNLYTGERIFL